MLKRVIRNTAVHEDIAMEPVRADEFDLLEMYNASQIARDQVEKQRRKTAALACHRSQLGEGRDWVSELVAQRAADAGRGQGLRYAEVFRVLRLA